LRLPLRVLLLPAHGRQSGAHVRHPLLRESNLPLYELAPPLITRRYRVEVPPILCQLSRQLYISFLLKCLSLVPWPGHVAQDNGPVAKRTPTSRRIIPLARNLWKSCAFLKSTTSETRTLTHGRNQPPHLIRLARQDLPRGVKVTAGGNVVHALAC
jgi:hypothetical protein